MHGAAALRYQASHDARGGFVSEERLAHLGDGLMRGAFAHADEYHAFADRHDIAALHGRVREILIGIAPPDLEVAAFEGRMKLVDGPLQQRFGLAGRPVHRVADDAPIDPAGWIALKQHVRNGRHDELRAAECLAQSCRHFSAGQIGDCDSANQSALPRALPACRPARRRMAAVAGAPTELGVMRRSRMKLRASLIASVCASRS